jgi:hypothetical protein
MLLKKVQQAAESITIDNPAFESKIQTLKEISPDQVSAIDALAQIFRDDWRMALAFELELNSALPMLHQALESGRREILVRVVGLMLSSTEPWTQIGSAVEIANEILFRAFGKVHGLLVPRISHGEVARLLGECRVNWTKPVSHA